MLSILIPVYNYDVRILCESILKQCDEIKVPFEIIVLDDDSHENFKKINRDLHGKHCLTYQELPQNSGRSSIRNKLASLAQHPYLLFIDCDCMPADNLLISKYIDAIRSWKNEGVIYGSNIYNQKLSEATYSLHLKTGINRESISAKQRNKDPYRLFTTSNFVIPASIFHKHPFNEKVKGYGHEDTLFAQSLHQAGIPLYHTDNPVIHNGLVSNPDFIEKTKHALDNILFITSTLNAHDAFYHHIKVYRTFINAKTVGLHLFLSLFYSLFQKKMILHLCSPDPSLFILDIFKLSYLCYQHQQRKKI